MGDVRFGLPQQLTTDLCRAMGIRVAIETGTYRGDSARALASVAERVVSIELSRELHDAAKTNLADLPNVTLINGSSAEVFPDVLRDLDGPAIFWLDGHWCEGGPTSGFEDQCPVMAEIEAIDASEWGDKSCVLIDDARFHLGPPPPPFRREDWPTITQLVDKLRAVHDRVFTVLDDVVVAGPPDIQPVIDTYWLGKQYRDVVAQRNEFRDRLWFPTVLDAVRGVGKAALRRKPSV
jgi:hypothetical protein